MKGNGFRKFFFYVKGTLFQRKNVVQTLFRRNKPYIYHEQTVGIFLSECTSVSRTIFECLGKDIRYRSLLVIS